MSTTNENPPGVEYAGGLTFDVTTATMGVTRVPREVGLQLYGGPVDCTKQEESSMHTATSLPNLNHVSFILQLSLGAECSRPEEDSDWHMESRRFAEAAEEAVNKNYSTLQTLTCYALRRLTRSVNKYGLEAAGATCLKLLDVPADRTPRHLSACRVSVTCTRLPSGQTYTNLHVPGLWSIDKDAEFWREFLAVHAPESSRATGGATTFRKALRNLLLQVVTPFLQVPSVPTCALLEEVARNLYCPSYLEEGPSLLQQITGTAPTSRYVEIVAGCCFPEND